MMKLLTSALHGLHGSLGITDPPPGTEKFYVMVWLLVFVAFVATAVMMVYLVVRLV